MTYYDDHIWTASLLYVYAYVVQDEMTKQTRRHIDQIQTVIHQYVFDGGNLDWRNC